MLLSTLVFETNLSVDWGFTTWARLCDQLDPGISLSLLPQPWDYKYLLSGLDVCQSWECSSGSSALQQVLYQQNHISSPFLTILTTYKHTGQ